MIDLYAAGTSNGMRARMALEECALPYELHFIALDKAEHKTPQFLAMNPNGQIPVMVDRDGPGGRPLTLSQSNAILLYCAEKSGRLMPKDAAARARMWQALMSAATDVTPGLGSIFAVMRSKEPHAPTLDMLKSRFREYLRVWDVQLARQKCVAGDQVTVADVSLYAAWARAKGQIADVLAGLPNLERWAAEMAARPAMQRATKW